MVKSMASLCNVLLMWHTMHDSMEGWFSLQTISSLEKDIAGLKKEIGERDETIGDKEKRIYDLKKKNQVHRSCLPCPLPCPALPCPDRASCE